MLRHPNNDLEDIREELSLREYKKFEAVYFIDPTTFYKEEVTFGSTVLAPTTFTPTKEGWEFVGWREDRSASEEILETKNMGSENLTLYAVFKQRVTCTFKSYDDTQAVSGYRYYNNGNIIDASITVPIGADMSGWSWRGWSAAEDTLGNAEIAHNNGNTINVSTDSTYYGLYQTTITLSYNGNGNTGGSTTNQTDNRYYNAYGNYTDPTFKLASNGFTKTSYSFNKWAQGSASGTQYAAGASVTLSANTTFYATWYVTPVNMLSSQYFTANGYITVDSSGVTFTHNGGEGVTTTQYSNYISGQFTKLEIGGNWYMATDSSVTSRITLSLINASGGVISTIVTATISGDNASKSDTFSKTIDISAYKGQNIRIKCELYHRYTYRDYIKITKLVLS